MSLDRPRFRRDLLAEAVEADGQRFVDVRDPATGSSFRLYDFEYHVALAFDGLAYETIVPWLRLACGIDITTGQLREFALKLHELGFLEGAPAAPAPAPVAAVEVEAAAHAETGEPAQLTVAETTPAIVEALASDSGSLPSPDDAPPEPTAVSVTPAVVTLDELGVPGGAASEAPASGDVAALPESPVAAHQAPPSPEESALPDLVPAFLAPDRGGEISEPAGDLAEGGASDEERPAAPATVPLQPTLSESVTVPYTHADLPGLFAAQAATAGDSAEVRPAALASPVLDASESGDPDEASPARDLANVVVVPRAPVGPMQTWPAPYRPASDVVVSPAQTIADLVRASLLVAPAAPPEPDPAASPSGEAPTVATAPVEPEDAPTASAPANVPEAEPALEAEPAPESAPPPAAAPADDASPSPAPSVVNAHAADSTAFPVLPTPPPQTMEPPRSVTPVVVMPLVVTPPTRQSSARFVTPPPYVTPAPTTLGPLLIAVRRRQRRSLVLFGSLGVLAAAAVLAIALPFFFPPQGPPRANVRSLTATPGTVFRYFANVGTVTPLPGPVMKFPAAGKVIRIAKPGTVVAIGDILAAVDSARPLLGQLTQQRERLAFYQQMAEGMHQAGNRTEEARQSEKVEARRAKVAKTLAALAQVAVVARSAGEVDEVFAREDETVEAGSLALRLASSGHRAVFDLSSAQAAEARRLGFCQVGVDGYVFDCQHAEDRPDDARVSVELTALPHTLVGRPARLARARYEGAVALPSSAVLPAGRHHQVYVASPGGRVEARTVTVAENTASEAIVLQGLDAGDRVVVEPPAELRPGSPVTVHP